MEIPNMDGKNDNSKLSIVQVGIWRSECHHFPNMKLHGMIKE